MASNVFRSTRARPGHPSARALYNRARSDVEVAARTPKPAIRSNSRGPLIRSAAFDNSSARSTSPERNGVWGVSGDTSVWFGFERVADFLLKDISNTQKLTRRAAHSNNSTERYPENQFPFVLRNSVMLFLLRYEPKGLYKTKASK